MADVAGAQQRKRTAVLVVHGMGSQRPLETVRGVVDAVWLEGDHSARGARRTWTHPKLSGVDIDLPVITTNFVPGADHRRVDFHELYWAHLMSETRAVAVLLWLFDLARMGPRLKPSIRVLYWGAVVFLAFLVLSVSLLATQSASQIVRWVIEMAHKRTPNVSNFHVLVYMALVMVVVASAITAAVFAWSKSVRLALPSAGLAIFAILAFVTMARHQHGAEILTNLLLPILLAALVIHFTMGRWGIAGLAVALLLSGVALGFASFWIETDVRDMPWSITSFWSSIAAFYFIAMYLALYAAFLHPYLGDAARYFRDAPGNVAVRREIRKQAVDTLESLHLSGSYDRIVIVAHSLGTVIAYDMLRAYYSRINGSLPDPGTLGPDFNAIDAGHVSKREARAKGRGLIRHIAQAVEDARKVPDAGPAGPDGENSKEKLKAWLVTDFVTLGSPLTHAHYLMCRGHSESELRADFDRRKREREFPTCPPVQIDSDGRLTFLNPLDRQRHFHHAGLFALSRWTNLYFPVAQLLWGDAIGGPIAPVFGDNIVDVPVWTNRSKRDAFFSHVLYWDTRLGRDAANIVALQKAIDLADTGTSDDMATESP